MSNLSRFQIILKTTFSRKEIDTLSHCHILHKDHLFYCYNRVTIDGIGWETESFSQLEKALKYFLKKVKDDQKSYPEIQILSHFE